MSKILFIAALALIGGCASRPGTLIVDQDNPADGRNFIELRTGQTCELKGTKIINCERNTYRYAENKADLEQMKQKEKE